ncbi:MAG: carboxylate-amine ligase [Coleofasciculaceae cyanobacterium]
MGNSEEFTIGVEEEYQIIDPETRQLSERSGQIMPPAKEALGEDIVQPEVHTSQLEIATSVCQTLADVRRQLTKARGSVIKAANQAGKAIAAGGTHPFSRWQDQSITQKERYLGLEQDYQQIIRDLVIFGCHVHVGLSDRELAIQTVNRARNWLSPLLALAANSPFWLGEDTGYASYRTELWYRWPTAGPPPFFSNYGEHQALIQTLIKTGVVDDPTKIYWDIRLSERFPTVEFRVTDICLTIDEAVMIAGLVRALVKTCCQQAREDREFVAVHPELLKAAHWRAARSGLQGNLINVELECSLPAKELIKQLLNYLRPALEDQGDWDEIFSLVEKVLREGNAAQRQYKVYQSRGSYLDVVDYLVAQTSQGVA